jgi:hypothetical protein
MIDPFVGAEAQFSEAIAAGRIPAYSPWGHTYNRLGLIGYDFDVGGRLRAAIEDAAQGRPAKLAAMRPALHSTVLFVAQFWAANAAAQAGYYAAIGDSRASLYATYSTDRTDRLAALRWLLQGIAGTAPAPVIAQATTDLRTVGLID